MLYVQTKIIYHIKGIYTYIYILRRACCSLFGWCVMTIQALLHSRQKQQNCNYSSLIKIRWHSCNLFHFISILFTLFSAYLHVLVLLLLLWQTLLHKQPCRYFILTLLVVWVLTNTTADQFSATSVVTIGHLHTTQVKH